MKILLDKAKRVVVKLGTGVLTEGVGRIDERRVGAVCSQVARLRGRGIEVVVVSSGSVGLGMGKLGLQSRPGDLPTLQACAAIGQSRLINTWQQGFDPHQLTVAQVLLTREDLRSHHRHDAISRTIERLLAKGVVPVVNENDTVSAAEIKFGDNDTLSALVSSVVHADLLFILSTIPGLMDLDGGGEVVPVVERVTAEVEAMARGTDSPTAVGGMVSKLAAAKIATRAGCGVFIGSGREDGLIDRLFAGESHGTFFVPSDVPVKSRKRWIAIQDHVPGSLTVDDGAAAAILDRGRSLLAKGVTGVEGDFDVGDVVRIRRADGGIVAHGITDLGSRDAAAVIGLDSEAVRERFPDRRNAVVVHRDNLLLLD